jgi:hypothetical protein
MGTRKALHSAIFFRSGQHGTVIRGSFFPASERFIVKMTASKKFREHTVFRAEQIGGEKNYAKHKDNARPRWKIEPVRNEQACARAQHSEDAAAPKHGSE